jgi:hypothetical protein
MSSTLRYLSTGINPYFTSSTGHRATIAMP